VPTIAVSCAAATFAGIEGFKFLHADDLANVVAPGSCDLAMCTDALEHIPNRAAIFEAITRYCRPGGDVLITVPIEVGPSLVGKQVGRYLANLRRSYGYETYRLRELFSAAVLWDAHAFDSSHTDPNAALTGHKGFDFRDVERELRDSMDVRPTVYSPLPPLGALLNSTVMWLCRARAAAR
jgi:SAM-dependent methyltransferase